MSFKSVSIAERILTLTHDEDDEAEDLLDFFQSTQNLYPNLNLPINHGFKRNEEIGLFLHQQVPLFHHFTVDETNIIGGYLTHIDVAKDTPIIKQGELGDCMYFLRSGIAKITRLEDDGANSMKFVDLDFITTGDYFGEGALLSSVSAPRTATVTAMDNCVVYKLNATEFQALFSGLNGNILTFAKRESIRPLNTVKSRFSRFKQIFSPSDQLPPQLLPPFDPLPFTQPNPSNTVDSPTQTGSNIMDDAAAREEQLRRSASLVYECQIPLDKSHYAKDQETFDFLYNSIHNHYLFSGLQQRHISHIICSMWKVVVPKNEVIIRYGDLGDNFYVLLDGKLGVYHLQEVQNVPGSPSATPQPQQYQMRLADTISKSGSYFGDMALLYNTPRNATVKTAKQTTLWVLDRLTFRRLIRNVTEEKLVKNQQFLSSVPLFKPLSNNERFKIAQAIEIVPYHDGDYIVKQGDIGETMYIIIDGVVEVKKVVDEKECLLTNLTTGQFFGEKSLLERETRSASVICIGPVTLARLDHYAFKLLLGPVVDQLHQNLQGVKERDLKVTQIKQDLITLSPDVVHSLRQKQHPKILANQHPDLQLKDFALLGYLGKGAYGDVQLVLHRPTNTTYALKTISRSHIIQHKAEKNTIDEKLIMEALVDSNNIVRLFATYKDQYRLMLLFEPCLGGDLFESLSHHRSFSERIAKFYTACIILALEHIHSRGIAYRDLKLENLLLDEEGYLKLTDFGLSKFVGDQQTFTCCGTPLYLAPEIILGTGHGAQVDLWALGVLIFEMITSSSPFLSPNAQDNNPMKIAQRIVKHEFQRHQRLSDVVWDLILRLMQPNPNHRLGAGLDGFSRLKKHPWFNDLNFDHIQSRSFRAPLIPFVRTNFDLTNINKEPRENHACLEVDQCLDQSWDEFF